ncbi:MAG: hypothetical protein IPG45_34695 [Deltaproteobacteria bacterium]|nr:hypothetical protein [Deltaproteobacteria bacterium]
MISVFLWALALAAICWSFYGRAQWLAGLYTVGLWWVAPHLATFNFGLGTLMSESVSTALFIFGLAVLARAAPSRRGLALSGVAFGAAALTRPYFEFVLLHPLLLIGAAGSVWSWYRNRKGAGGPRAPWAVALFTVALSAQAITVPWRVYRLAEFGSPSLTNFDQLTNWAFVADEQLPTFHHSGNAACHADPDLCELVRANRADLRPSLVKKLALMTAVTRPLAWARFKWANLDWLWFGAPWGDLSRYSSLAMEGSILLGLFVLVTFAAFVRVVQGGRATAPLEVIWIAFVGANFLGFFLFQFEWRYSHALRVAAYLMPLLFAAVPRSQPKPEVGIEVSGRSAASGPA